MAVTKFGLTDLERAKYTADSTSDQSTVRVQVTSQPIDVNVANQPVNIRRSLETVEPFRTRFVYMTNPVGGSREQNIVGSLGAPVNFEYTFTGTVYLRRLDFVIASTNIITYLDYGLVSGGLANGVLMGYHDGTSEFSIFNAQRWIDFSHFVDDQIGHVEITENPSEDFLIASFTLNYLWKFTAGQKLFTRIRDDLSGLRYHRTSLVFLEPN